MNADKGRLLTIGAIVALLTGIALWDVFLLKDGVPGNTISSVVRWLAVCPAIPYAFGLLFGHLFWPKPGLRPKPTNMIKLGMFMAFTAVLYVWYAKAPGPVMKLMSDNPIAVFVLLGLPAGHFGWPQYSKEIGS